MGHHVCAVCVPTGRVTICLFHLSWRSPQIQVSTSGLSGNARRRVGLHPDPADYSSNSRDWPRAAQSHDASAKNGFFYVIDRSNGKLVSAENYVPQNWTTGIDLETGRPKVAPETSYVDDEVFVTLPSGHGGYNWQPMAYHPYTGLVYIPAQEIALAYQTNQSFEVRVGG
jgi:hypothetical protein